MQNLLIHYMKERFREDDTVPLQKAKPAGPVITFSREAGCSANLIAEKLKDRLNKIHADRYENITWNIINKEIIEHSARELELHPSKIQHIFKGQRKSLIDEMVLSMSTKYYKSDWRIKKTISDVINSIARQGYVIIIGRAGVAITQNYPKALHLKFQAPLEWRIETISKKHQIPMVEAKKYVLETDKSRHNLLQDFNCDNTDCNFFDACLNCRTMNPDDLVEVIVKLIEQKRII